MLTEDKEGHWHLQTGVGAYRGDWGINIKLSQWSWEDTHFRGGAYLREKRVFDAKQNWKGSLAKKK